MEIVKNLYKIFFAYFNTLSFFGYKKQNDVDKMLVYDFITSMLTGNMRFFITEQDYKTIDKALYCLYGTSCLIPYPEYLNDDSLFEKKFREGNLRITEDNKLRKTEFDNFRIKLPNYEE